MQTHTDAQDGTDSFSGSRRTFDGVLEWLGGAAAAGLRHADLETEIITRFRALACQAEQEHLDLRAEREPRLAEVVDADGVGRGRADTGRERSLATVVGQVMVARIAYREPGYADLHPADAMMNLPPEKHSHGLRRLAAVEASRGSFTQAAQAIDRATGVRVGKRQVEALTVRAAADVDSFYAQRRGHRAGDEVALAMTADAKGVVVLTEALRPSARKARTSQKLTSRLSAGEKRTRKRMAEVVGVFDCVPAVRTAEDILPEPGHDARPGPRTTGKWLTASVVDDAAEVIGAMFDEATRRDPAHRRPWICLLDGNAHQIDRVVAEATDRGVTVTIIVDFIHVLEYLWGAVWCLHPKGDPAAESWVRQRARQLLAGHVDQVVADLSGSAAGLADEARIGIDRAVTYLTNQRLYLDYPTALARGWPIATGVIEGACRHLVKDRMDITGARWGLDSAEAVLKLRAVISNDDLDEYWAYHLDQEYQRVHKVRYAEGILPEP
jgi:hypothetical protein